jgi:pimeloyl-ACP methyl ester carboxylesterase
MNAMNFPGLQHGKMFSNGIMHHFVMAGQGPAIVLLHGWLGTSYHWRKVIPLLAKKHTVLAIDARGYGESDKPYAGYDGKTLAADVIGILDGLGIAKATMAGHDMGALTALLLAAEHPQRTTGLVYIDEPLPGYNLDQFTAFTKTNPFVFWWFSFNSQQHLPALLWQDKEDVLVDYFLSAMCANPASISAEDKAEYVRGLRKPGGLHGSFGWYRDTLKTADQIVAATQVKMKTPVLALNGQFGIPGVVEQMRLVAEKVSGETLPFCGHLLAEEQPEKTALAIENFVTALHQGKQ